MPNFVRVALNLSIPPFGNKERFSKDAQFVLEFAFVANVSENESFH